MAQLSENTLWQYLCLKMVQVLLQAVEERSILLLSTMGLWSRAELLDAHGRQFLDVLSVTLQH